MGHEVKRVPLDFDWPQEWIWIGYMGGICSESVEYATGGKGLDSEELCRRCRYFGKLAGLPFTRYDCPRTKIDPPTGDGWQLWETVSEGSPCSPVFATAEELAQHLADGGGHPLGEPPTYEQALAFVRKGWAPSMIRSPEHGLESGVVAVGRMAEKK